MNFQYLRRLLSVACACLCVLFSSSHIVYADDSFSPIEIEEDLLLDDMDNSVGILNLEGNESYLRFMYHWFVNDTPHWMYTGDNPDNVTYNEKSYIQSLNGWSNETKLKDRLYFTMSDGSRMFSKGSSLDISLSGISNYNSINNSTHSIKDSNNFKVRVEVLNSSGTVYKIQPSEFDIVPFTLNYSYNLTLTVDDLPCDVYSIYIIVEYNGSDYNGISDYYGTSTNMTHHGGLYKSNFEFVETVPDDTDGLLSNIIAIVNNIKDGIINLPSKIANSIKGFFDNVVNTLDNVKTAITTALETLGNMLLDGIKNLFVPSEEEFTEMQNKWEQLLADRFGAIYQAVALIFDYVDAFQDREQGTIEFPVVSIPLGDGTSFDFGGYTVKVVPDGFGLLIDALKMVVSISCTVLFVNTLKRKYDKLVEG